MITTVRSATSDRRGRAGCTPVEPGTDVRFAWWATHFADNADHHRRLAAGLADTAGSAGSGTSLSEPARAAFVRSLRRFALGERGDGAHLLASARESAGPVYAGALRMFVAEEQAHARLFATALRHLGATESDGHWTDAVFTVVRRAWGLHTEIAVFLIAESVALGYFEALADAAPDPVLRAIGSRVAADEREHVRFQVDRLGVALAGRHRVWRAGAVVLVTAGAGVAATVLVVDHGGALVACGLRRRQFWWRAVDRARSAIVEAAARDGWVAGPATAPSRGDHGILLAGIG